MAWSVLVVEDNDADARLLAEWLPGHGITRVGTLRDGIEKLAGHDVVLLDLTLPDSFEAESVRRMRAASAGIPIVVMTGHTDERLAMEAMRQGAQQYLVKGSVSGESLPQIVSDAIERAGWEPESTRQAKQTLRLVPADDARQNLMRRLMALRQIGSNPVLLTVGRTYELVKREMDAAGVDGVFIIDASARNMDPPPDTPDLYVVGGPLQLERMALRAEWAAARNPNAHLLVDRVDDLVDHVGSPVFEWCHFLVNRMRVMGVPTDLRVLDDPRSAIIADSLSATVDSTRSD